MATEFGATLPFAEETKAIAAQKLALAELARPLAPPFAQNLIELAGRFHRAEVSDSELKEARTEAWTYLGSLACYCSETDSLSAQLTLIAVDPENRERSALVDMAELLSRMGVSEAAIRDALVRGEGEVP